MITVMQISGVGLAIGDVDNPDLIIGYSTMKNPRVLQMQEIKPGVRDIILGVLIGDPSEMLINHEVVAFKYTPHDELANKYREAVSGLTLAKVLPKDGNNLRLMPKK